MRRRRASSACSRAHARGKGVFFVTGHFGYWEMQAIAHPFHSPTIAVLARPLDNPRLHALLERLRTMTGNRVLYRQGALRRVLRELTANNGVAMLIDQHLHTSEAVYVDYFGRPAATTSALAALALRTGAAVIPVFALPLPGGRYRFVYEHPVEPPPPMPPDPVLEFTQRCTDVLEMYVRRHPELWLWMHRRWREREPALAGDGAECGGQSTPKRSECGQRCADATMPEPRRILVLAPNWLGDAVMALPAIADLRRRVSGGTPGRGRARQRGADVRAGARPRRRRDAAVERAACSIARGVARRHRARCATPRFDAARAAAELVRVGVARAAGRRAGAVGLCARLRARSLLTRAGAEAARQPPSGGRTTST